ncbi:MAG: class I SAM-dependent methyltransferase [Acidimicrobiales bacterium]
MSAPSLPALRFEGLSQCPICGERRAEAAFESPDLLHDTPGRFRYVRCVGCRTTYQNPRVHEGDLGLCYPGDYFTHGGAPVGPAADPSTWAGRLRTEVRRHGDGASSERGSPLVLRWVGRVASVVPSIRRRARFGLPDAARLPRPGGRCLELGPGGGHDLVQLTRLGWDAVGLEVDPSAAAAAVQVSGRPVHVGTVEQAPWPDSTFDLVYSSHVFEHLPRPRPAAVAMLRLLAPGGRLAMIYPNPRSLTARLWPEHAVIWDPPRHLVLPPARAIGAVLADAGFVDVRITTLPRAASVYAATARQYRRGVRGWSAWTTRPRIIDRLVKAVEVGCGLFGLRLGEELLVSARRPS